MSRFIVVLAVFAGLLFSASSAQADIPGYPKAQRTAEKKVLAVAVEKYDVTGITATCERSKKNWKCEWVGMVDVDDNYEPVHGTILLKKRGYKVLRGMKWGYGV